MTGLLPVIHVLPCAAAPIANAWMPGSSPGMTNLALRASFESTAALAPHRRGAVETGGDRVERDVGPALRVHEFFPAPIEEALVVLRNVALGHEPRIIRMRRRMPQPHRQILGVPAAEAARARQTHLAPV